MTDVVTEKFHVAENRGHGVHDSVIMEQHIPQPGGEADPFYEQDKTLAKWIHTFVTTRFPVGYEWCVRADLAKGVIMFSIPILMGVSNWYVVNLRKTPDLASAVLSGAGEILERYKLSRSTFSAAALLDAREQHSALVVPGRKVPT